MKRDSFTFRVTKRIAPRPLRRVARPLLYAYSRPDFWQNALRVRRFSGRHTGDRCFIIGNGPSLQRMDLSLLRHEYTFGLNRIYLKFSELGFATTYHVTVNRLVLEQCADDISNLDMPRFISWPGRHHLPRQDGLHYLGPHLCAHFSKRPWLHLWEGSTVTFVAMQLAYYMGFGEVILIGVDHDFETKGPPHQEVTSQGEDKNHFHPDYFGKGFRWQLPDLEGSERAYWRAKEAFEGNGRCITDATIGGKLEVFPKVDYYSLF